MKISLPSFSSDALISGLDTLVRAYEEKGMIVSLLPGIDEAELRARCHWFPGTLPQELVALYGWRGGQAHWDEDHLFWLGDNLFPSLEMAEQEYASMMETYGTDPEDHEVLKYSFPFAAFNGGWYVLPTADHPFNSILPMPVLSVFQGVEPFFYSIQTMVDTYVEWVRHEQYTKEDHLPAEIERAIWEKHNPGIFGGDS
jgi:hypothetical protein